MRIGKRFDNPASGVEEKYDANRCKGNADVALRSAARAHVEVIILNIHHVLSVDEMASLAGVDAL